MKKDSIDVNSLAHTKWDCKSPIVCAPTYRRKVFYEDKRFGDRRNTEKVMRRERSKDHRGRGMPGSHTYVGKYSAPNEHFGIYGASEREERIAHFSEKEKYEVCKLKPRIWCKGYYVDTAGKNKGNQRVHGKSVET